MSLGTSSSSSRSPIIGAIAFVLGLVAFLVASLPETAGAQVTAGGVTITVNQEQSLPRLDANGNQIGKRELQLTPEGINFQDCEDNQQIDFPLALTGFVPNASLEAWASISGADCGVQTNRVSASAVCWNLVTGIPLQTTVEVKIPVRKIISGAPPFTALQPNDTVSACGQVDLVNISVQFLYFPPGQAGSTPTSTHTTTLQADTVGPPPPTGLSVLPGNTRIKVSWDNISGEGGVSALTGVAVYCDPATTAVPDAGSTLVCPDGGEDADVDAGEEAGAEGGAETDAEVDAGCVETPNNTLPAGGCTSPNFVNPDGSKKIPDAAFHSRFQCGSITGATGTSVIATQVGGQPLKNDTLYAVAVAGTDAFGNVGVLSDLLCETPEVTTDFWDAYREAGGDAGGGFCATSGGMPGGSFAAMSGLAAFGVSLLRRRMKRR